MNYLLTIDTTSEKAIVNLTDGPEVIETAVNYDPKRHAFFLHTAIQKILQNNDISISDLQAIGVTGGPGSYTGIRVGLATAKGLCFALKKPMMVFNTLEVMAFTVQQAFPAPEALYCPMIEARRNEVFTALYDSGLKELMAPSAMILDENSFREPQQAKNIYFSGSGAAKFEKITRFHQNTFLPSIGITSLALGQFTWDKFLKESFTDYSHASPFYVKEFYSPGLIS